MFAVELIGHVAIRNKPARGDTSYCAGYGVRIAAVRDGLIYIVHDQAGRHYALPPYFNDDGWYPHLDDHREAS